MSLIAAITGLISDKEADSVLINIGGFTLRVFVPVVDILSMPKGEVITLQTHLVVREDDLQIYGFLSDKSRSLFESLISVNGVGPKVGLSILSSLSLDSLVNSIASGDVVSLSKAQGVGKRTAERIIVELRSKLQLEASIIPSSELVQSGTSDPALNWLASLGFSQIEARQALSLDSSDQLTTEERVRLALQRMGKT